MLLATVVGQVWSTHKDASLDGIRMLIVQPFVDGDLKSAETMVVADPMGAGIGERVVVVFGRAARHVIGQGHDIGIQTAICAIVDGMELEGGRSFGPSADLDPA
ncbi:MAG: ethanolamine utilization protein EutN [Bacteroidia bacterium]|jgi:ethanolamine utilization protein EutN